MADLSNPPLRPIDSLVVDVLTDNVSDAYVSKTLFAVSEFSNVVLAGANSFPGRPFLVQISGFVCGWCPRPITFDIHYCSIPARKAAFLSATAPISEYGWGMSNALP